MVELYAFCALVACLIVVSRYHGIVNLLDPVSYFALGNIILGYVGIFYRENYIFSAYLYDEAAYTLINGLVCFTVGVWLANLFMRRSAGGRLLALFPDTKRSQVAFATVAVIGVVLSLVYAVKLGGILWLAGGFDDARVIERQGFGWLVLLGLAFVTVGSLYMFVHRLSRRQPLPLSMIVIAVSACVLLLQGNRAPAVELLVAAAFFYCLFRWGRVPLPIFALGLVSVGIVLALLGIIRSGQSDDWQMVFLQLIWRPYVNLYNFQTVVESFPVYLPYQWGRSFLIDVYVLVPGYQPNFGLWIKDQLNMNFAGGSVTVGFAGEMYANFGRPGVYAGYFMLAFLLVSLSRYLRKLSSPSWLLLRFLVSTTAKSVAVSGLVSPVLYVLAPSLVAFFFAQILIGRRSKPMSRRSTVHHPGVRHRRSGEPPHRLGSGTTHD